MGYGVLCAQDISSYYEEMEHQLKEFCRIFTMVLAITCLTVYLVLGRVLEPLKKLTETAARLGDGDLSARADISRKDETGELASAFNIMADRVEKQVDDLRFLLGALTHEIKTPMTSILGYSDTLLRVNLPEERRQKALRNINHAGKRLERLSAKMLALLGSYGTKEIRLEPCLTSAVIREVETELEPFLSERQITIETECIPDFHIIADQELLTSLLVNLVNNAVKASPSGSRIWISCDRETLVVMDEGCGIPADALPHVKDPFFMVDKSRSRSEGGSGLGLALCDRIAVLHGMELRLQSRKGKGTKAVLYFTKRLQSDEDFAEKTGYH